MIKASTLISQLETDTYNSTLLDIDPDNSRLEYEKSRYINACRRFIGTWGDCPVSVFSAPGRSEICGNHTDHQYGEVLACSINRDAIAVAAPREDGIVQVISDDQPLIELRTDSLEQDEREYGTTKALIKGVLRGIADRKRNIGGFNCFVTSDVLIGAGLSSSAAFETIIGTVINGFYNDMKIKPVDIAKIGQFAENDFFGKPCGLMDQMACSLGSLVHIDFADPDNPEIEQLAFDLSSYDMSLCITDTKGSHSDLTADYAAVPEEMTSVARYFGEEHLRNVPPAALYNNIARVREQCGDRAVLRALHFYAENRRVRQLVQAIKDNDIASFLNGIQASGDSSFKYLQNVYTIHDTAHQNVSLALCASDRVLCDNKGAARVHGGGFAGTIQAFVRNDAVNEYRSEMNYLFGEGACSILKIRKYGGIRVV